MKNIGFLVGIFFFFSCSQGIIYNQSTIQTVDECNFHVGQFGVGLKWENLPVPLTLHKESMDKQSVGSIIKVVDEMNIAWKNYSNHDQDLLDIMGLIAQVTVKEVSGDGNNTVSFVTKRTNRISDNSLLSSNENKFLTSNRQAVTQVKGRLSFIEADIFVNNEDFNFYFEDDSYLASKKTQERSLASYGESFSLKTKIKELFSWLWDLLFFWQDKEDRGLAAQYKRIPANLVDFESLIAHELGHVLGLGHNEAKGSIMKRKLAKGALRRGLKETDLESLSCGYNASKFNQT